MGCVSEMRGCGVDGLMELVVVQLAPHVKIGAWSPD